MSQSTVKGKVVVFVIMAIVGAAVAAALVFADLRRSLHTSNSGAQPAVPQTAPQP